MSVPVTIRALPQSGDTARLPIIERSDVLAKIHQAVAEAAAGPSLVGVMVVEICQLDEVNHDYGYAVGDALVRAVTTLLRDSLRPRDYLARIGTDELLLLLPGLKSTGQPLLAAQRIQARLNDRLEVGGRHIKPNLHIGLAVYPLDGDCGDSLLRAADAALMQCARLNQDVVVYSESRVGFETALLETQYDLAGAIDNGELFCQFQPKVGLADNRFHSVEALSRWRMGDGSMVSPAKFIAVAEQNGLITPLTYRSLNEALRECAEWQAGVPGLDVAVNLSAAVFSERHLHDIIIESLNMWSLPPERLILEVTESAVMNDVEESVRMLEGFRNAGIKIAIDDFGTGHSSLAYLRRLPATELKIDRSFVMHLTSNADDRKLVQAIIDLARALGLSTVAEGIEDQATLDLLRDMGCDVAQGYFIARPLDAGDLLDWFAASPWHPPAA